MTGRKRRMVLRMENREMEALCLHRYMHMARQYIYTIYFLSLMV